jgi:hypothetical protein
MPAHLIQEVFATLGLNVWVEATGLEQLAELLFIFATVKPQKALLAWRMRPSKAAR